VTYMRGAVIGLVALAACAGCATGTRSAVIGSNGAASPATTVETEKSCEGWYNAVAGVCDSLGD
jgi:ammonia channel protein AmtB